MVVLDRQCGQKRILLVRTAKLLLKMEGRHTWHGVECAALLCLPYHACLPACLPSHTVLINQQTWNSTEMEKRMDLKI